MAKRWKKKDEATVEAAVIPVAETIAEVKEDVVSEVPSEAIAEEEASIPLPEPVVEVPVVPVFRVKIGTSISAKGRIFKPGQEITPADIREGLKGLEDLVRRGLLDVE